MTALKIMSFNMRMDTPVDGEKRFLYRKDGIAKMINRESPDIIGFQEITDAMRDWIVDTLTDYYTVGVGREANYSGESSLIAYKKDRMFLLSADTVMLSHSPTVFGSRYDGTDQSVCPRVYTKVCLKHRFIAEPFFVYNVHTDHRGQLARILATTQLLQDVSSHQRKVFITGDFNADPDSAEIKMMTESGARRLKDATKDLGGTFHDYGRAEQRRKIDYVFADVDTEVITAVRIPDEPKEGENYLSDHNPIYIIAQI